MSIHSTQITKPTTSTPFAGLVLAGGQSTRMGSQNKALAEYQNKTLLEYSLEQGLGGATTKLISTGPNPYQQARLKTYIQLPDDGTQGPLAGINQGLLWLARSNLEWLAIMPCDTPFVPSEWASLLLGKASTSQALYVTHSNRKHYAHSLWHVSSLKTVQHALTHNKLAIRQVLQDLEAQPIDLTHAYPLRSFTNINTMEALNKAQNNA